MLKSGGIVALGIVALSLVACGPTDTVVKVPVEEIPATPPPPPKPARIAQMPLPTPDLIAQDLVKAIADETKGQFFPAKADESFPGGVRMSPESKATIFPPANATSLTISAALESDAWLHHAEYNTDGVAITIDAIGANGASIARQELVIDPAVGAESDPPATLSAAIPAEADHLEISFSGRGNNALDNTTVILTYQ